MKPLRPAVNQHPLPWYDRRRVGAIVRVAAVRTDRQVALGQVFSAAGESEATVFTSQGVVGTCERVGHRAPGNTNRTNQPLKRQDAEGTDHQQQEAQADHSWRINRATRRRAGGLGESSMAIVSPPRYFWSLPVSSTAMNAFCGMSTLPIDFIRFLPSRCLAHSLRLRVISPP